MCIYLVDNHASHQHTQKEGHMRLSYIDHGFFHHMLSLTTYIARFKVKY
jgi:hypothetical protein